MSLEEDRIYEDRRTARMNTFWLWLAFLVFGTALGGMFMYYQYRTPDAVHAENCKTSCSNGVQSVQGNACVCNPPAYVPAVRDVKALSCTCMPVPVGEEEKREDAMRKIMEDNKK